MSIKIKNLFVEEEVFKSGRWDSNLRPWRLKRHAIPGYATIFAKSVLLLSSLFGFLSLMLQYAFESFLNR